MLKKRNKIKLKVWSYLVKMSKQKNYYPLLYRSYWYCLFNKNAKDLKNSAQQYFTATPNFGAGIGHQIANWISGYWFAKQFGVAFVHSPFSSAKWDAFLGLAENEKTLNQLIKYESYKKVKLPLFDENKPKELSLIQNIVDSYSGNKVVFVCEQDQFYREQYGVIKEMQEKFYSATSRKEDKLRYDKNAYNVAIHVRRGDIVAGQNKIKNHTMRWMANDYFLSALHNTLNYITTDKKVNIYLFSQGKEAEFIEFEQFPNLTYCLDMGAIESFLHMVYADVLITSKSSFSYKPALLNKGLKIVPSNFWHGYPSTKDWIQVSDEGQLLTAKT